MRILVFGDIHYPREGELLNELLKLLAKEDFDYLAICGDIINFGNAEYLRKFLSIIHKRTEAKIIAVMGNHDFWLSKTAKKRGYTSWDLIKIYQQVFREFNDVLLWDKEYVVNKIGFVGVPGWYDYSFAAWHLRINRRVLDQGYYMGYQWNDAIYTRFDMRVEEILERNLIKLEKQLNNVRDIRAKRVIVLLHFVPLREFIVIRNNMEDFWNAYLGSYKLGELIRKYKEYVNYVFFGHTDPRFLSAREKVIDGIRFINVDISDGLENIFILEI